MYAMVPTASVVERPQQRLLEHAVQQNQSLHPVYGREGDKKSSSWLPEDAENYALSLEIPQEASRQLPWVHCVHCVDCTDKDKENAERQEKI